MEFQFQTGSIKRTGSRERQAYACGCFNSKLVRLKGKDCTAASRSCMCFNSKLVRLKAISPNTAESSWRSSFNSKLVRLKVATGGYLRAARNGFNSKLVRLKVFWLFYRSHGPPRFNSKLVRLKGVRWSDHWLRESNVSIPNWFD